MTRTCLRLGRPAPPSAGPQAGSATRHLLRASSMLRAVSSPLSPSLLLAGSFIYLPLTRVRARRGSMTQRSPSIRAHAQARGPLRLYGLDPDTRAAVPSSFRSPERPNAQRTRSTREMRRPSRAPTRLSPRHPLAPPRSSRSARAQSAVSARRRRCQCDARVYPWQSARETIA